MAKNERREGPPREDISPKISPACCCARANGPNATRTPIGTGMFISPLLSRLFCGDVNVWRTSSHEGDVATFDRHERVGLEGTARRPLDRRSLEQGAEPCPIRVAALA